MKTRFRFLALFALFLPAFLLLSRPPSPAPPLASPSRFSPSRPVSLTLLDEIGRLARPVAAIEATEWRSDLHTGKAKGAEAAKRQLWLGEWELAQNENPIQAEWHLRQARKLSLRKQAVHGIAAYDSAILLYMTGCYAKSSAAFRALLAPIQSAAGTTAAAAPCGCVTPGPARATIRRIRTRASWNRCASIRFAAWKRWRPACAGRDFPTTRKRF